MYAYSDASTGAHVAVEKAVQIAIEVGMGLLLGERRERYSRICLGYSVTCMTTTM